MLEILKRAIPTLLLTITIVLVAQSSALAQANIVIQNADNPGVGFNDTTPATPVGGNSGTTVGAQRLIAFQSAASIWGAALTSGPTITIRASWAALPCTTSSGTLGSAGNAGNIWREFPGGVPGFWYGNALANAISGVDRNGSSVELNAQFNMNLGTSGCLDALHWYYGLDNNHGSRGIDLVSVLLHEFGHGLGFQSYTNTTTGQQAGGQQAGFFPSIFDRYLFDNATGKSWTQMTDSERVASAINVGHLVWNGPRVLTDVPMVLTSGVDGSGRPFMYTPNPVEQGSSVSHWDMSLTRNQVMEPNISNDLFHSIAPPQDLTMSLMRDIGWTSNAPVAPTILLDQSTSHAAAMDSVTHVREPFTILTSTDLSSDGHRRIIFFTTDLGLNPGDDLSVLSVRLAGIPLAVESAGPWSPVAGTSYVVVRLADGIPTGNQTLTITLRGVNSTNAPAIAIQ
jgi:hypothetical protein